MGTKKLPSQQEVKALKEIQRDRRLLQLFIEHTPAAIAMFDSEMRYISASRRFLIDLDIDDQNIIGKSHYEVFPDIPERWKQIHQRCLKGAIERCDEDPFPRASGKLDWVRWEIRPWFEQADVIGGIILFSEVITEQKKVLQQLRESEEKFRDLFYKHAAIKLLIDPDNGAIIEANCAAERFYGWTGNELRRMRIHDINTLSPEHITEELRKARDQRQTHFEFRHRLANGTIRDVEVFRSRIDSNGKPMLHSIIHDVTERRNLEEQLRQSQKLQAVGRLAGGIAHEFNNMLAVILGFAELGLNKTSKDNPLHSYLKEILTSGNRAAEIARQLLAFARKQIIAPKVLNLNDTVADMLKMLRHLIGENIEFVWLPAPGLWPVRIDPAQIDQILVNLCINARDAINHRGTITIATENLIIAATPGAEQVNFIPGEFVKLSVSDNGCGMEKDTLAHLFEPFFTTKEVGQGTGLGLPMIYGIVHQNGGFITVDSEPGKGTTCKIYLPKFTSPEPVTAGPKDKITPAIPSGRGKTVLMVEDEASILTVGKMILNELGYTVLTARLPAAAINLAQAHHGEIDLLITDVLMPDMNGQDLARQIRILYPNIKILYMSAYPADIIAQHGQLEEVVNFIHKPFSMNDLAHKVHMAMAGK